MGFQNATLEFTFKAVRMHRDLESDMYTARLMAIKYRTRVIPLDDGKKRKRDTGSVQGVKVGFDSGSDLTYFTKGVYDEFVQVVSFVLTSCCRIFHFSISNLQTYANSLCGTCQERIFSDRASVVGCAVSTSLGSYDFITNSLLF